MSEEPAAIHLGEFVMMMILAVLSAGLVFGMMWYERQLIDARMEMYAAQIEKERRCPRPAPGTYVVQESSGKCHVIRGRVTP